MSYEEMIEILARWIFVDIADYLPGEWDSEPERRRVFYRQKAQALVAAMAARGVWVTPRYPIQPEAHRA